VVARASPPPASHACSILCLLNEPSCGAGFQPANSQCVGKHLCRQDAVGHSRTKASDDTGYTPTSHSTFDYEHDNAHEHDRTIPVDSGNSAMPPIH